MRFKIITIRSKSKSKSKFDKPKKKKINLLFNENFYNWKRIFINKLNSNYNKLKLI